MFKKEIIKKDGKIYEVIYQDSACRHININYIAEDYDYKPVKKKEKKDAVDE